MAFYFLYSLDNDQFVQAFINSQTQAQDIYARETEKVHWQKKTDRENAWMKKPTNRLGNKLTLFSMTCDKVVFVVVVVVVVVFEVETHFSFHNIIPIPIYLDVWVWCYLIEHFLIQIVFGSRLERRANISVSFEMAKMANNTGRPYTDRTFRRIVCNSFNCLHE